MYIIYLLLLFVSAVFAADQKPSLVPFACPTPFEDIGCCYGPNSDESWTFNGPDQFEAVKRAKQSAREEKARKQKEVEKEVQAFKQKLAQPYIDASNSKTTTTPNKPDLTPKQIKKQKKKASAKSKRSKEALRKAFLEHCAQLPNRQHDALQFLSITKKSSSTALIAKLPFHLLPQGIECALGTNNPKTVLSWLKRIANQQIQTGDDFHERLNAIIERLRVIHDPRLVILPAEIELVEISAQRLANITALTEIQTRLVTRDMQSADSPHKKLINLINTLRKKLPKTPYTKALLRKTIENYELELLHRAVIGTNQESVSYAINTCKQDYKKIESRVFKYIEELLVCAHLALGNVSVDNVALVLDYTSKKELQIMLLEHLLLSNKKKVLAHKASLDLYQRIYATLAQEYQNELENFNTHIRVTRPLERHSTIITQFPEKFNLHELLYLLHGLYAQNRLINALYEKLQSLGKLMDPEPILSMCSVENERIKWQKLTELLQSTISKHTTHTCGTCKKELLDDAVNCQNCEIQFYCTNDCLSAGKTAHKTSCNIFKNHNSRVEMPPLRFFILLKNVDTDTMCILDNRGVEYASHKDNPKVLLEVTTRRVFLLESNQAEQKFTVTDPASNTSYRVELLESKTVPVKKP